MSKIKQFTVILLKLPDDRIVLQRRTDDALYAPGKLGMFGGHVEPGETPDECIHRELAEEISLKIKFDDVHLKSDLIIEKSGYYPEDRHFFAYEAAVPSLDFEVYEGKGAEAFTLEQIRSRTDLNDSANYFFNHTN